MTITVSVSKSEGSITVTAPDASTKFLIRKELVPYKERLDKMVRQRFIKMEKIPDEQFTDILREIDRYKRKRVRDIVDVIGDAVEVVVVKPSNGKDNALFDLGWVYLVDELVKRSVLFI